MSNSALVKRSGLAGKVPTLAQLQAGALAMNTADRRLFFSTGSEIVPVARLDETSNLVLNNGFPAHREAVGNNLVSIDSVTYLFNTKTNGNRNIYLSIAGDIASNVNGYAIPMNALVYSVTVQIGAATTAATTFELRRNSNGSVITSFSVPAGTVTVHVNNIAVLLAAGDEISCYMSSAVNAANPLVVIRMKWRN